MLKILIILVIPFISGCGVMWENLYRFPLADLSANFELSQSWTPEWANLAGYWKLNGTLGPITNGATIVSTVGPNGVAEVSGSVYYELGQLNQSIFITNLDTIDIPASGAPNPNSTMSALFWMRGNMGITTNNYGGIVGKINLGTSGWMIQRDNGTANIQIRIDTSGGINQYHSTSCASYDGNWHHIALVLNNGTGYLYCDGQLDGGTSWTYTQGTGFASTGDITGGYGSSNGFSGDLDDLSVWLINLSSNDVAAIYSRQVLGYQYINR